MNILRFFLVALVWGLLCHGNARADVILRGFDPVVPNTGQIPSLVLDIIRGGGITTCEGARADVPASVSVQGNLIIVKLFMSRIFIGVPACQAEPSVIGLRWPLASVLPPGTFTVRVFGCAQCFGTSTSPEFLIGELPITILAADMPVPMLGLPQLILFSFTLLLVGVWRLRNATSHLAISLLLTLVSCTIYAQNNAKPLPQLSVELKPGLDIAALVQSATANNPNARAFSLERPKYSSMPGPILNADQERAVAQLPNHPVMKQRRTLVLTYAPGTNLLPIQLALRADPRVVKILDVDGETSEFSAATISASSLFSLPAISASAFGTQYGVDALNLPAALRYQDGWAVGAIIDSGLDSTHPEFQAFSGFNNSTQRDSGSFLGASGGNLLRGLSGDNWLYQTGSSLTPNKFGRNIDERRCVAAEQAEQCEDFCKTDGALDPSKCMDVDASCKTQFGVTGIHATAYGHGTHTAGLFGASWSARTSTGDKVLGTCPGCGIALRKITLPFCQRQLPVENIIFGFSGTSVAAALWSSTSAGASVASLSLQTDGNAGPALLEASARGILLVAAAGNDKDRIQYPASLSNVAAAGGFMPPWPSNYQQAGCLLPSGQCLNNCVGPECFWVNASNYYFNAQQCSSNTSLACGAAATGLTPKGLIQRNAELTVAAKQVMSTFYRTTNSAYPASWTRLSPTNIGVEPCVGDNECQAVCGANTCPSACSEDNDGVNDGYGKCTGTSMAAPQLAGLYALLLSSNPLLTVESTIPNASDGSINGVRDLLATTARAVDSNNTALVGPWNSWYSLTAATPGTRALNQTWGAGIPRANLAMEKLMGTVSEAIAKHRLTPLFVVRQLNENAPFYQVPNEFAYATAPSVISSFLNPTNGMGYYTSLGPAVRGFSGYLLGAAFGAAPPERNTTPGAEVFVLANNYRAGTDPISAQSNAPALPPLPAGTDASKWQVEPLYSMMKCRTQRVPNDDLSKAVAEQCVTPPNFGDQVPISSSSAQQKYRSPGFESLLALEREVTALNAAGYDLRGKVGYVVVCKPGESCTPLNAAPSPLQSYVRVVRACKGTNSNLATFDCAFTPQSNLGTGNYASYTESNQPSGLAAMPITYAWANAHSDSDDLIDGQELILGTNAQSSDSDTDGLSDSNEWPVAAVQGEHLCWRPLPCPPPQEFCLQAYAYQLGPKDPMGNCGVEPL